MKISSLLIIVTVQSQESERLCICTDFVFYCDFSMVFCKCSDSLLFFTIILLPNIISLYFFNRFQAILFTLIRTFVFLCQIYFQHNKISTQNHGRKFALTRYSFLFIMKNKYYLIPHCGSVTVPKASRKIV